VEILVLELVLLTVITSSRVLKELLSFDKQNMAQFRQTLQISEGDENGKVKSKENDVASHGDVTFGSRSNESRLGLFPVSHTRSR
jgi:hypothetical protein